MRAKVSDRMPQGTVYTTFHYPVSGANVVTTEYADWATNCPEYKVTAVQVSPGRSVAEHSDPAHVHDASTRLAGLVRMANQIARQYEGFPADEAVPAIGAHLAKFWEREMLADLLPPVPVARSRSIRSPTSPSIGWTCRRPGAEPLRPAAPAQL